MRRPSISSNPARHHLKYIASGVASRKLRIPTIARWTEVSRSPLERSCRELADRQTQHTWVGDSPLSRSCADLAGLPVHFCRLHAQEPLLGLRIAPQGIRRSFELNPAPVHHVDTPGQGHGHPHCLV